MNGPALLRQALASTTQTAFAAKSGVPQSQLSLYASGKRRPGYDNRVAIERATGGKVPASSWTPPRRRPARGGRARH
jgi:DNA-binding transcriptional regulator YdaS (Cro superfamily)